MNSDGTMNSSASVPMTMPPTAPVPNERLPFAPTPLATISGSRPKIMVNAVINIGRRRASAALNAEAISPMPALRRSAAYSVSKMAVLRKQSDEHDQSRLQVDVILQPEHACEEE